MELKVWVDGLQRVVCGLAERTTCQEVIYALAHATGKTGRFVLVEKWRTSERSLSPHDRPLELLSKWGEYASDVQLVLRCLEDTTPAPLHQRPSSVILQRKHRPKLNGIPENYDTAQGHYLRMNHNSVEKAPNRGKQGSATVQPPRQGQLGALPSLAVLKPYFVDTSSPNPESGTLVRPTSAIVPVQEPKSYEVANPLPPARDDRALSPSPPSKNQQYNYGGGMAASVDSRSAPTCPSLTILSHSTHESLNPQAAPSNTVSFDSSGAYLESSYSSSNPPQKQLDLSQTSFCNSSMSSATSNGAVSGYAVPGNQKVNASRPPPPSYETFIHRRNNQMTNRNRQTSPAPIYSTVRNGANRSRTPVLPTAAGTNTREQLMKVIESQQAQLRSQWQTMGYYDTELARSEDIDQQKPHLVDSLFRELRQLEVERVHVKQKVEELRRQDFDGQLSSLRKCMSDTLMESAKIGDHIRSIDAELAMNEDKIRQLSMDLDKERGDVLPGMSGPCSLNDAVLESREAFEARVRNLDSVLMDKKRQLDEGLRRCGSPLKHGRVRSLDQSMLPQNHPPTVEVGCPGQRDNAAGVWV